jgi:hypothetical protein
MFACITYFEALNLNKTLLQSNALSPDSLETPKAFAHEKSEINEYS